MRIKGRYIVRSGNIFYRVKVWLVIFKGEKYLDGSSNNREDGIFFNRKDAVKFKKLKNIELLKRRLYEFS